MLQPLTTRWGEKVSPQPWQCYPRPQLRRDSYVNLNGHWDFAVGDNVPAAFAQEILVPFCVESALSGINKHFEEGVGLWYRKTVTLPPDFNRGRVLLHVGAADQVLECYVNLKFIGRHEGICAMTFDITGALEAENEILFKVTDDLRNLDFPYGKQTLNRGGMWYTPVSGIWQTVWLESVPETYIQKLTIKNQGYSVTIDTGLELPGTVTVPALGSFPLENGKVTITPENPRLWSPEDPWLYDFTVEVGQDRAESYFAIRALEIKEVAGIARLCLNGKPCFFHGLLDQGYWPDGIYTPASPEAYTWDILEMKKLGFNTLRKHIKVEPEEFYYQCDKLGMIVFQDMVNNGDYQFFRDTAVPTVGIQTLCDKRMHRNPATRQAFLTAMETTVRQLENHPSICYWTIFNEGWGQFDSTAVYHQFRKLDDTRFIDSTSGWWRRGETQVDSRHIYFGQWRQLKKGPKPVVLSEFGGLTYAEAGHIFNPDNAYGYKTCKTREEFQTGLEKLYREVILPAIREKGLCAAIYTQVSDVEDEINGLATYDRRVIKAEAAPMQTLARQMQAAIADL